MEKINLSEFDIMGIFTLQDVSGIENFVSPISDNYYLSRNSNYYQVKTYSELSEIRQNLISSLTNEKSKRNFVILENMLNASAKIYYSCLKNHILFSEKQKYFLAKNCFEDDVKNIINILSEDNIFKSQFTLPKGNEITSERAIELDNKALLYLFCKNLEIPKDAHILTPGYGSLYIGPFMHTLKGNEYSNLLKSSYIKDTNELKLLAQKTDFLDLISNKENFKKASNICLLDDNVGTGQTMYSIKGKLEQNNINVVCGAVQYNWINRFRFFQGEKDTIFDPRDFDFITPFNYPGHKLLEHAIENLKVSGDHYISYLKSKSYRNNSINDFLGSIARSEYYTSCLRYDLYNDPDLLLSARKTNISMKKACFQISTSDKLRGEEKLTSDMKTFLDHFITTIQNDSIANQPPHQETNKINQLRDRLAASTIDTPYSLANNVKVNPKILSKKEHD